MSGYKSTWSQLSSWLSNAAYTDQFDQTVFTQDKMKELAEWVFKLENGVNLPAELLIEARRCVKIALNSLDDYAGSMKEQSKNGVLAEPMPKLQDGLGKQ